MANGFQGKRARYRWLPVALLACACALAVSCGDDSTEDDAAEDAGATCTPGRTETGCMCSDDRPPGSRHCGGSGVWEACVCPPPQSAERCTPGQEVLCFRCPGESERRRTTCLDSGTYDCSCRGDGGQPRDEDAGR